MTKIEITEELRERVRESMRRAQEHIEANKRAQQDALRCRCANGGFCIYHTRIRASHE